MSTATAVYRPSPIKRQRRSRAAMDELRTSIFEVVSEEHPATVRQVFYQLVGLGVIDKSEAEYKSTVVRLLTSMRLDGTLPFGWIADNTRWMRKPQSHSSLAQAVQRTAETYRRSLWDNQDAYVEIWLEKDALAGVLYDVTEQWDVPLMVTRGYPSVTFLHSASEAIAAQDRPCYLYYFGDHDPSGVHIPINVEKRLREFAPEADIHFERVAVTLEQIVRWGLPTRPTKKTDTRSRNFQGESVEVDAIPPRQLRSLATSCIERHINSNALYVMRVAEDSERKALAAWAESVGSAV